MTRRIRRDTYDWKTWEEDQMAAEMHLIVPHLAAETWQERCERKPQR
ncbi:hypothetical protein [Deinococcus deserti]|nr:hypothetical protein [Deinococcus deserti]